MDENYRHPDRQIIVKERAAAATDLIQSNAENRYEVTSTDLPLSCPMHGMTLWNSHPKVYLAIESTGQAQCPYCGANYVLK